MQFISPAINIGIGKYGSICMKDLARNFSLRESQYTAYVSFHQLNSVDGMLNMNNYNFETQNFHAFEIDSNEENDGNQNLTSWELHNFVSQAYNSLITLAKQLNLQVNFNAIHINLIFAAFEIEHLELLEKTILLIDRLNEQGVFGGVRVKCFSILPDGNKVSTPLQEENVVKTLDSLVEIRKNYNVLSHNFILDDKNTQAVSLEIEDNYLGFAISEIIVALIRNEYKVLGALHNPIGVFSIGFGMVYFDKHFFSAFIKNRILESKIEIEKIHDGKTKISTTEYRKAVNGTLIPYVEEKIEIDSLVRVLQDIIDPSQFVNTLLCYKFLLANLLGHHDTVQLEDPIDLDEVYSVDDMIYWNIYQFALTDQQKAEEGLLNLKDYKKRTAEYEAQLMDSPKDLIDKLEEENQVLEKHRIAVSDIIKHYANNIWRKHIVNPGIENINKQVKQAKEDKRKLDENFKTKNFIAKLFGRGEYNSHQESTEKKIQTLKVNKTQQEENETKLKADLDKLYEFKSKLKKSFETLNSGITQIHSLKQKYQKEINGLSYLNYEFLHNIISPKKLREYESTNREKLQSNIKDVLKILFIETPKKNRSFTYLMDEKIKQQTSDIIDFNMSNHLLNEYDDMELLKPFDFNKDLKRLKQRSFPFFNAIPIYTHKSHFLKYFDNADRQRTLDIQGLLKQNYTGSIPSYIHSESPNKFALLTIEVIDDLKSIVKYNNHFWKNNN